MTYPSSPSPVKISKKPELEISLGKARRTNANYDALIARLEAEKNSLENNLDYMNTDAFIEEQAREHFGMIKDGETLYIYE